MPVAYPTSLTDIAAELGLRHRRTAGEESPWAPQPVPDWLAVWLPVAFGALALAIGLGSLCDWWFNTIPLNSAAVGHARMKPNTALCFALLGTSLLLPATSISIIRFRGRYRVTACLGIAVASIGLLNLVEQVWGVDLLVDRMLFPEILERLGSPHAGRMAAASAAGFLLLGAALASPAARRLLPAVAAQGLILAAMLIGLLGLLGYLYSAPGLVAIPGYGTMTPQSAGLFVLLGLAALIRDPGYPLTAEILSPYRGGVTARGMLPLLVTLPIAIGTLCLAGERAGWYSNEIAIAMFAAAMVAVSVAIVWSTARRLNRVDIARRADERTLQHFAALVESSDDAIIGKTVEGIITSWNPAAHRLFGFSEGEAIGQSIAIIIPPERIDEERMILSRIRAGHTVAHYETVRRRQGGESVDIAVTVSPIRDAEGQVVGASKIARDISDLKKSEAELAALAAELEQRVQQRTAELRAANAELESFSYAVAHDLRAPLRAMNGFSQALIEDFGSTLAPEARGHLQQIVRGSNHLGRLIDGLLQLSRSTQGQHQHDPIDIGALGERLLREFAVAEPGRKVTWEVARGMEAHGDERMLEAALRNLIGNAWKYTAKVADARIRLYSENIAGQRRFCIADNGAGFDMAYAGKLFVPFQRLHRQDEFQGIGIGLATVQRIVHRHGGTVGARSSPGQGACFWFTLAENDETGDAP